MPHLRFRGVEKKQVVEISTELLDKLSSIIGCPKDHFTLEYIPSTYIFDGEENSGSYPFVEVKWFKRDENAVKSVAGAITDMIKKYDYEYVTVYFEDLKPEYYYENGEHF